MRLLHRLSGLETEYNIRFRPDDPQADRPSNFLLYNSLITELRRVGPTLTADHTKKGIFVANGGAIWFEVMLYRPQTARIEGATPECRSPRTLLAHQRAQDSLLAAAARDASVKGEFVLIKGNSDSGNKVYGAQENYEVTAAAGHWLRLWRLGLLLIVPYVLAVWIMIFPVCLVLVIFLLAAPVYIVPLAALAKRIGLPGVSRRLRGSIFGAHHGLADMGRFLPHWLGRLMHWIELSFSTPIILALLLLTRLTLYREIRRKLVPFLVTRQIFCGSGNLMPDGSFNISAKAPAHNTIFGIGSEFLGMRSIITIGHFFKALMVFALFRRAAHLPLFSPRQRLQICVGDSNLCEEAEYLRIATTQLIIDLTENGQLPDVAVLAHPIRAMRVIAADPSLTRELELRDGTTSSAIEIQRFYLRAIEQHLRDNPVHSPEADEIVRRWREVLDLLEADRSRLVGRVDWITKKFLLDQVGADESWEVRKKVDLRYHELSPDGYFSRLQQSGCITKVLDEQEIERAMQNPPPDSPACVRADYVRRLSSDTDAKINWVSVSMGKAKDRRRIAFPT